MTKYTDFINYHLSMLVDETRTGAYSQALSKVVKPGDVVVDVGCGSGILSFFACRAGARHVYAVESEAVIKIAELVAAENGLRDRITFYHDRSFNVELPEPADVIVTETMGTFGFEEGILGSLADARDRFLKKGGTLIPHGVDLFLVPVELPQFYEHVVDFWVNRCQGFDFSPVRHLTVNNFHPLKLHEGTFLGDPMRVQEIEFGGTTQAEVKANFSVYANRRGWFHGLAGLAFFPIERPVFVERGNRIEVEMSSTRNGEYWHWNVSVNGLQFEHSTSKGSLPSVSEHPTPNLA